MKILIFGASGAGTTTLGHALGQHLQWPHLDADDYYWAKTQPPFQEKIPLADRNAALLRDFSASGSVILSGSVFTWGAHWYQAFDLAIFLWIPAALRMERLRRREEARYGAQLRENAQMRQISEEFLVWAAQYDDPNFDGKSIAQQQKMIAALPCPVLKIEGDTPLAHSLQLALERIDSIRNPNP